MRTVTTPIKRSRYLVFDVETTGLLPKQSQNQRISISDYPYIIQLSFVIYDLEQRKIIKTYDSYIKIPETVIISQYVSNLTGITNEICNSKGVPITDAIRNGNDPAILVVLGDGNSKVRLMITEFEIMEQLIGEENE